MNQTIEEKNKTLVLKAFDTLFNKRDYAAARALLVPQLRSAIPTDKAGYQAMVSKSPTRLFAGNSADELGAWASLLPGSGLLQRTFGTFLFNRRLSLRWPKGARQACERTRR